MIACLPMYDWPERHAAHDRLWQRLSHGLRTVGFRAPKRLTRHNDLDALWRAPDLLLGETCSYPLETSLRDDVKYVATPIHNAPGTGEGTYRSVIIAQGSGEDRPVPTTMAADLPDADFKSLASNGPQSMSGFVALSRDMDAADRTMPAETVWTGSHRASIRAVASGKADIAAIDCVSFELARHYEPAVTGVRIIGWTAQRPGLPLITSAAMATDQIARIRHAIGAVMPITVLDRPTER